MNSLLPLPIDQPMAIVFLIFLIILLFVVWGALFWAWTYFE